MPGRSYGRHDDDDELRHLLRDLVAMIDGTAGAAAMWHGAEAEIIPLVGETDIGHDHPPIRHEDVAHAAWRNGRSWLRGPADGGGALLLRASASAGSGDLVIRIRFTRLSTAIEQAAERVLDANGMLLNSWLELWRRQCGLRREHRTLEDVLDQMDVGVLLIELTGRIRFANAAGREMVARGDGLGSARGTLRAARLDDGVALSAAMSHVSAADAAAAGRRVATPLLAFHREQGPPLMATLAPLRDRPGGSHGIIAVMHLLDPVLNTARMLSPICAMYRLSPVETSLVCELAAGRTVAEAAATMHVQEQTARGYLKHIFVKTNTRRQTELIVVMLSSLLRLRRELVQQPVAGRLAEAAG